MRLKSKSSFRTTALAGLLVTVSFLFLTAATPDNTAVGSGALSPTSTGANNTASGYQALAKDTKGADNTADGYKALFNNTTGSNNIGLGSNGGFNLTTGNFNIDIGNQGVATDGAILNTGVIRIGTISNQNRTFIAGIYKISLSNTNDPLPVVIDKNGQLGTASSQQDESRNAAVTGNTAAEGVQALNIGTTGSNNTATGWKSLFANTKGTNNTANGFQALSNNTEGEENTATGSFALFTNTKGNFNTADGFGALAKNTSGDDNTASGYLALNHNTTGNFNTATGFGALSSNTTGFYNTANGVNALHDNVTGYFNYALGVNALNKNTTGNYNTAIGALDRNVTGNDNVGLGYGALEFNNGDNNVAVGNYALYNNRTGANNIALGNRAGSNNFNISGNNIYIGNLGDRDDTNTIRIGENTHKATFIAGITSVTNLTNTIPVTINPTNGQLCACGSSERFKKDIKPMNANSEVVMALKPVMFHYKNDNTETPQFGLVAEEVEKVNPALVVRDGEGKVHGVRYDAVNAMLLNEFLKEHRKVEELEATVAQQQKAMETLAAGLAKVSAQIEATRPVTRLVDNRP